jgi:hypothetical protein
MSTISGPKKAQAIYDLIWAAIPDGADLGDVVDALLGMLSMTMSVPDDPDVRKRMADYVKDRLPGMLSTAHEAADRRMEHEAAMVRH